jgi:hypothetical protein
MRHAISTLLVLACVGLVGSADPDPVKAKLDAGEKAHAADVKRLHKTLVRRAREDRSGQREQEAARPDQGGAGGFRRAGGVPAVGAHQVRAKTLHVQRPHDRRLQDRDSRVHQGQERRQGVRSRDQPRDVPARPVEAHEHRRRDGEGRLPPARPGNAYPDEGSVHGTVRGRRGRPNGVEKPPAPCLQRLLCDLQLGE